MTQSPTSSTKFLVVQNQQWRFIAVIAFAIILRCSLLFLPAPGRDEATYFYWAQHFEPAYSLLLQLLIKLFDFFPFPEVLAQRMPSFLCGISGLVLLSKVLQQHDIIASRRHILIAAVAITPWQIYVGAISHPDNIFLCVLLLIVLADLSQKQRLGALLIGLSVLAKPTGIIVLGTGILYYVMRKDLSLNKKVGLIAISLLAASPALAMLNSPMMTAMAEFGRISEEISTIQIVFITLLSLFGLGALLLPLVAIHVMKKQVKHAWQHFISPAKTSLPLWIASALILTFTTAALFRNQIKGNWLLPAFILLLPYCRMALRNNLLRANLVFSIVVSSGITICFIVPRSVAYLENSIKFLNRSYTAQAGTREAKISSTASWRDRVAEYQPIDDFVDANSRFWNENQSDGKYPQWLICDDYGLAAQMTFAWNKCHTRLVIPADGIFSHANQDAQNHMHGNVLLMAVHAELDQLWPKASDIATRKVIQHPVTGSKIELGILQVRTAPAGK